MGLGWSDAASVGMLIGTWSSTRVFSTSVSRGSGSESPMGLAVLTTQGDGTPSLLYSYGGFPAGLECANHHAPASGPWHRPFRLNTETLLPNSSHLRRDA